MAQILDSAAETAEAADEHEAEHEDADATLASGLEAEEEDNEDATLASDCGETKFPKKNLRQRANKNQNGTQ